MRLLLSRPIASIDVESTGRDPERDAVVELGVVVLHTDGSRQEHRWLVKPWRLIPPHVARIHGHTDASVANSPPFTEVAAEIAAVLAECDLAGYNLRALDLPLLRREFDAAGIAWPCEGARVLDAYALFCELVPRNLGAAVARFCGREHRDAHTALGDARATLDVLLAQVENNPGLPASVDALEPLAGGPTSAWATPCGKIRWNDEGDACAGFGRHEGAPLVSIEEGALLWMARQAFLSPEARHMVFSVLQGERPRAPGFDPLPSPRRPWSSRQAREEDPAEEESQEEFGEASEEPDEGTDAAPVEPSKSRWRRLFERVRAPFRRLLDVHSIALIDPLRRQEARVCIVFGRGDVIEWPRREIDPDGDIPF